MAVERRDEDALLVGGQLHARHRLADKVDQQSAFANVVEPHVTIGRSAHNLVATDVEAKHVVGRLVEHLKRRLFSYKQRTRRLFLLSATFCRLCRHKTGARKRQSHTIRNKLADLESGVSRSHIECADSRVLRSGERDARVLVEGDRVDDAAVFAPLLKHFAALHVKDCRLQLVAAADEHHRIVARAGRVEQLAADASVRLEHQLAHRIPEDERFVGAAYRAILVVD